MHALMPSSITLVLVAGEEQRRNSLAQQLEALGYSVIAIGDHHALADIHKLSHYDLLVIDLHEGGAASSHDLRAQAAALLAQGTPILMLNADQYASSETWTQETLGYRITAALRSRNATDILDERAQRWEGLNVLDPETLLFSRRYFDAIFATELERSKRVHQPTAILLIDLSAAPPTSTAEWRTISGRLLTSTRQTDLLVRYAAAIVLILLPVTEAALARAVATRLHKTLATITLATQTPLQPSVGIAAYPAHGATADAVLSAASHALNRATQTGAIVSFEQL
jgi:GGDEF domain-containing protein